MDSRIRIAVVDDHPLFREGVTHTLRSAPDIDVVAEGTTAKEAIEIGMTHVPDIMLLDVSMPGGGIEAAREVRRNCAAVKTVMLTVSESEHDVAAAFQSGVKGYILKGSSGPELLHIIRAVQNCESYVTPTLAGRLLAQPRKPAIDAHWDPDVVASLTHRETQVLQLLSQGLMNKEIAHHLKITERTVKYHMTDLMQKLKVRNRVEAVLICRSRIN